MIHHHQPPPQSYILRSSITWNSQHCFAMVKQWIMQASLTLQLDHAPVLCSRSCTIAALCISHTHRKFNNMSPTFFTVPMTLRGQQLWSPRNCLQERSVVVIHARHHISPHSFPLLQTMLHTYTWLLRLSSSEYTVLPEMKDSQRLSLACTGILQ